MLMGVPAGYCASHTYKALKGTEWKLVTVLTATLYPGAIAATLFVLNFFIWGQQSSGAIPFGTMVVLLLMWFGVSVHPSPSRDAQRCAEMRRDARREAEKWLGVFLSSSPAPPSRGPLPEPSRSLARCHSCSPAPSSASRPKTNGPARAAHYFFSDSRVSCLRRSSRTRPAAPTRSRARCPSRRGTWSAPSTCSWAASSPSAPSSSSSSSS